VLLAVASLLVLSMSVSAPQGCEVGEPIPAYAHNDYENERPLYDALALGYQGVEADIHLVDGQLLVAHDRDQVVDGRTLESLYLEPLAEWRARCGRILAEDAPLLLNVEIKSGAEETYTALVTVLRRYRQLLTVVRDGTEKPGAINVVLVGWQPPLDALRAEKERLVAVQWQIEGTDTRVPDAPAHLIRLVSVNYGNTMGWSGSGVPPYAVTAVLERLVAARDAVPGRLARAHNVPVHPAVYEVLLSGGVALIGTVELEATERLLRDRR
jgi:hypothetical protein